MPLRLNGNFDLAEIHRNKVEISAHIPSPVSWRLQAEPAYLLHTTQLNRTTHISNRYSGYVTITHPFHPLQGQRLKILSTKKWGEKDIFSLQTEEMGTIAIARDWTDKADPGPYSEWLEQEPILSLTHLVSLSELLYELDSISKS